jgi:Rrf2 family transcriptional regulator, iron-sulfur cluster assembly transcription factor
MFSKKAEYALRATIYIAQKSTGEKKLAIGDVARSIDAPQSFTAKILQLLTKDNRIISSSRGPNGGFYITDDARKLSVRKVLEIIGEDEVVTKCVLGLNVCSDIKPCPLHSQYSPVKKQLLQLFENKTIQNLATELDKEKTVITNKKPFRKTPKK